MKSNSLVGDIIFFKSNQSLTSKVIAKLTKSSYTHVGLIISHIDSNGTVAIIESDRKKEVNINFLKIDWDVHLIYRLKNKAKIDINKVLNNACKYIGIKYDYFKILGMFISLISNKRRYRVFNSKKRIICSELIDMSYYLAGVRRLNDIHLGSVTPNELLNVYEFEKVAKFETFKKSI